MVVFVALGLTVHKVNLEPVWKDAILIALVLAFLARPLGIAPFLAPLHLRRGERVFVMWSGLKGAVPILLAAFALLEHVPGAERIYGIVFVVVAFSVIVQGGTVPFAARRLGVPMRLVHRRRRVIVAHLDLDAFFAAVEELETPELRAKPLVVGGDPHGRGVVATANYVARRFGIHSAMSCAEALRRCPQAVFVQPRKRLYSEYSKAVWNAVREVVPTVERTGMDEGYLDVGEVAADFGRARAVAEAVQAAVRGATSLSCSLGVSSCKVVSKIASDRRKPGGLTVVPAGREAWFLGPVRRAPAAGRRPACRGAAAAGGVETIGDLAALEDANSCARCCPASSGRCCATGRAGSTRGRSSCRPRPSRSAPRRRSRATWPRSSGCRRSCAACPTLRRRTARGERPGRPHGHDEGALPGLLDPLALDLAAGRHRRRRADLGARLRVPRPGAGRPARARYGWSASASPAWRRTASSSSSSPLRCSSGRRRGSRRSRPPGRRRRSGRGESRCRA